MDARHLDDLPAQTRVGDYTVSRLLGEGGMGKVYEATGSDGGRVALKVVKLDFAQDETFRHRFRREARIAQTVKHPNVVSVLATGEQDGLPYMAQTFIEGMSLDEKLQKERTLDVASTVRVCADVAAGLDALWAASMVHRDVKPGNILLDRQGTAYVTDFGLAKDMQGTLLTRPGQSLGSMDYMAPEQIRGESLSAATDVYALGCVAIECVCGSPPFAYAQGMRILWAQMQDEPPDPREARADLSPQFASALLSALAKEAGERPASAGEYARLLAAAAA